MELTQEALCRPEGCATVSGNKIAVSRIGRVLGLLGGVWGGILAIGVTFHQLDLGAVLRGEMSISLAFSIGGNALPILALLLCLCLTSIWLAIKKSGTLALTSVAWLVIGGILTLGVYLARFSMGPLLLPSAGLIFLAGLLAIARLP
ncbi:hypothetical protein BECAL_01171 [Bellilinea caldifistulae]|uniref:Uncharacterized protein n=2 Tax=Bellilinea caldifistulae TaxID=360411 RepID=A0A0P6XMX6_9CHLR|nr:hypothetical protein AC812_02770 [Bellilinea caldifistulae]GAP10017.1 hypothetical protein BECAL_01171 [Bellilinea caldifistulae]GIV63629.1 MAG: hypothetical protein KatS3mg045_0968 [Bellilinea sp.]